MNATRTATPSEELHAIATEARKELESAEARIGAMLARVQEIAATAVKDQTELRRFLDEFSIEPSVFNRTVLRPDSGTGPLFDVEALRAGAEDLRNDVLRSSALEANLSLVAHMLHECSIQLAPERAFGRVMETVDLRLQQAMNSAREEERRRLAREIHDGPAQVLSNAIFSVHTAEQIAKRAPHQVPEELAQLRELLKDGVAEIRRFMFDLRPTMLQDLGLGPTLARYVDDYSRFFAKNIRLNVQDELPHLTPDQELTIFRIVQEALQNVHKHGGPGAEAMVDLRTVGPSLHLTIADNGRGFDPSSVTPRVGSGAGLPGMRERASLVNGEIQVDSEIGKGTTVTFKMPLRGHTGSLRL